MVYTDWLKQRVTVDVALPHVVTVDRVVVHIGSVWSSARSWLGTTMLAVGPGLTRSEFIAWRGLTYLGTGVYIGAHIAVEVEVTAFPRVGVGFSSPLQ